MFKIKQILILLCAILILLNLNSCFEVTDITKINRDGSLEKTIIFKDDSSTVMKLISGVEKTPLPIPLGDDWHTDLQKDSSNLIYTARKSFKSSEQLNKSIYQECDSLYKINPMVTLEKKFHWFYSYYYYKEVYPYFGFKRYIPIEEYLTEEEITNYHENSNNSNISNMVEMWVKDNVSAYFQIEFSKYLNQLQNPNIKIEKLEEIESTLFTIVEDVVEFKDLQESAHRILKICQDYYKTEEIFELQDPLLEILSDLQKRSISIMTLIGEFDAVVEMPGILLATNADIIEGNVVKWEFEHDRFSLQDFEMTAQSRVINTGVIYLTIFLLLLLVAFLLLRNRKKDHS